jgi:hypothetical protein
MIEFRFKIPELEALPPEKREAVWNRCLASDEYARSMRKIRRITFITSLVGALTLIYTIQWSGIVGDRYWLGPVFSLGILALSVVMMMYVQFQLMVRLMRKLVKKELDQPDTTPVAPNKAI